jgi:hypothetical protein
LRRDHAAAGNYALLGRTAIEGRTEGSARWITRVLVDSGLGLKNCELHEPCQAKKVEGEN